MYRIGIDFGGSYIKIGILKDLKLILKNETITKDTSNPQEIIKDTMELVFKSIKEHKIDVSSFSSIGVGSPGIIDEYRKSILYSCNIKFDGFKIESEIKKYIDTKIFVENDANVAALGEHTLGGGKGSNSSLTITLGTGVGGGFIIDNKIFRGFNNSALEIGHMSLDIDGKICTCGRNGCFESYCSAVAFDKLIKENASKEEMKKLSETTESNLNSDLGSISKKDLATLIFKGYTLKNKVCLKIVEEYVKYLADAIANLINILSPEK